MKRFFKKLGLVLLLLLVILGIVYMLGPTPDTPKLATDLPKVNSSLAGLDAYLANAEKKVKDLRPDNEARIVWADPTNKTQTEYAVVYLHGFSASWMEGEPVHREFAKRYGYNLYLPRLFEHGIRNEEVFGEITVDKLYDTAKEAIAVGKLLGKKIIIMATSTGSPLAMHIAANHPETVKGLILYSPLVRMFPKASFLLDKPWGLQIAQQVFGGEYYDFTHLMSKNRLQYWTTRYRVEALVMLQNLVMNMMTEELFKKVKQPVFMAYYYKDEANQDNTVSVEAMKWMFAGLGTPEKQKRSMVFPKAGAHVIASKLTSGAWQRILKETVKFGDEVLGLQ